MRKLCCILPLIGILYSCSTKTPKVPDSESPLLSPMEFVYPDGEKIPTVTLVGTFHFAYPDKDVHKTDSNERVDVLSPKRQKEMQELRDYIAAFNPNKIVIESSDPVRMNRKYREFLAGDMEAIRDERYQLGFYLARRFKIDSLYCLDANSFTHQYDSLCPALEIVFADYDWQSDDPMEDKFYEYLDYRDKMLHQMTLLDFFKRLNSEESWNFNYGSYLIGDFKLPDFQGVDALSAYWYNRNLRTFRKIQMVTEDPEDRILVIFGNGHVSILDQLFKCSPEYNYIPFGDLK